MSTAGLQHRLAFCLLAAMFAGLLGCEGVNRKHDARVADIQPPPEDSPALANDKNPPELSNFPDLVEDMLARRSEYIDQMVHLERAYLAIGDSIKANWARRQRELTETVDIYPFLTAAPPEHRLDVSPEESIPEADAVYDQALTLLNEFRGIPMVGYLEANKKKAKQALNLFKRVLRDYPKSDRVDDSAFYCGEIYKEYLRDDDPDNELAIRYYKWAVALDPQTPHAARFQCAVLYDFRRHDRSRALELYTQVLEREEDGNLSNQRFAASRIEQLTDEDFSHLRPKVADLNAPPRPRDTEEPAGPPSPVTARLEDDASSPTEPDTQP